MDFPKDKYSRHFSSSNYIQKLLYGKKHERNWLIYSRDLDRVFCFCCKLFNVVSCTSKLVSEGSKDWRNLSAKLKSNEITNEHIINMNAWIDLEMRLVKNKTIDKHVQKQINRDREHWRNVLLRITVAVKTLCKNNLAFQHIRQIKDDEIHNHYLEHNIQNELINLLADEIKIKIIKKIKDAKYYAIILDCTPYISHQRVNVCGYFINSNTNDTIGKYLFDAIVDELKIVGLDINDLRGQGYDNGSNMKGKHYGVQKRFLDINPRSFYTFYGCHSLNLVFCDMANSCPKATSFFGVLQCVYTLFSSFTKRWKILQNHIHSLTLKSLSQTSWESRIESVKAVRFQTLQIRDALFELKLYRENGFENALISTKEIVFGMNIEPKFHEKRISHKKKQFDENVEDEIVKSLQESFRVDCFLYIVSKTITTLQITRLYTLEMSKP
ncbi:Zinc finger MYM-type protein 5 [Glycine soja]